MDAERNRNNANGVDNHIAEEAVRGKTEITCELEQASEADIIHGNCEPAAKGAKELATVRPRHSESRMLQEPVTGNIAESSWGIGFRVIHVETVTSDGICEAEMKGDDVLFIKLWSRVAEWEILLVGSQNFSVQEYFQSSRTL